ncbi:unnamed protein product [Closterium sp. Naga37s-1]|nr:unnamed protein product [Closterium sp. Naga37s-1]
MGAGKIAAGRAWLSLRELAVITVCWAVGGNTGRCVFAPAPLFALLPLLLVPPPSDGCDLSAQGAGALLPCKVPLPLFPRSTPPSPPHNPHPPPPHPPPNQMAVISVRRALEHFYLLNNSAPPSSPIPPSSPSFPHSLLPHQMAVISVRRALEHFYLLNNNAPPSSPIPPSSPSFPHSLLPHQMAVISMAVISVRRALEHFYLARSVSARWLWKLTKDPTQSAIRKVGRGLTGLAHFLSPLSSVAVQLITDTFTAFHRLLFPPPPPQAGQGLAISPVRATGVQIVWLVKRTLSYSLKLVFSTASGALLSAVCVRYVGPWTTSYAYILGDMLVYQTASTLIDPLLFSATT